MRSRRLVLFVVVALVIGTFGFARPAQAQNVDCRTLIKRANPDHWLWLYANMPLTMSGLRAEWNGKFWPYGLTLYPSATMQVLVFDELGNTISDYIFYKGETQFTYFTDPVCLVFLDVQAEQVNYWDVNWSWVAKSAPKFVYVNTEYLRILYLQSAAPPTPTPVPVPAKPNCWFWCW